MGKSDSKSLKQKSLDEKADDKQRIRKLSANLLVNVIKSDNPIIYSPKDLISEK